MLMVVTFGYIDKMGVGTVAFDGWILETKCHRKVGRLWKR